MNPTVSAVITTHNRKELLLKAIQSIQRQTHTVLEILVVDDCGHQDLKQELLSLNEPRLQYYRFETPQGANPARNQGIEMAQGQWIAFLDDDDTWHPNKIQRQLEQLHITQALFSYTGIHNHNPQGKTLKKRFYSAPEGPIFNSLMANNFIGSTSSIMVKRELLIQKHIRFDAELPSMQDYDFYLNVFQHTDKIAGVPEYLLNYRQEQNLLTDKTSSNFFKFNHARQHLLNKYQDHPKLKLLDQSLKTIQWKKCIKYPKFALEFFKHSLGI